jgi:Ca-activated chloride channel family protein
MRRFIGILTAVGMVFGASAAWAQGLLIVVDRPVPLPRPIPIPRPVPSATYAIKEISVQAKLLDQVARVQVSQSFVNTGNVQLEVQFVFPLPYDGAIDQLTLLVDGKEYPAQLLPAKEARARYEAIVRTNRDPALLEWMGQGMFQTSVFPVPPGAERKITLNYNQLLRKDHGLTDFLFPLSTAKYTSKPVQKVDVQVSIESGVDIKNVYSPTHPIEIQRPDGKHAIVKWSRTNEVPGSDFRLLYDVGNAGLAARVVTYRPSDSDDGYFLLLASPPIIANGAERPKKTVMFVVDKSGSMSGKKIEQAKAALKFVLNNLRDGDLFNIVAYDGVVESFRPELEKYNDETRKAAIGYVEGLYAGGGTNIHDSLTTALNQLKDSSRPNFVIFLTDGLPTIGERNESKIVAAAKSSNSVRARVLPFGVGYDVNSRLLDRVARENFGLSEYVRPEEDIEAHVSKVYNRIGSPVMTNVEVKIEFDGVRVEDAAPINRVYPKQVVDLFEGEQLVLVGRYKKSGAAKVVIDGHTSGKAQHFDFPADFTAKSDNASYAFVEKLWATRRIGEIIDQIDLHGKNDELVKELVDLSTKHGILTPYTSFLADETARPRDLASADRYRRAFDGVERLGEAEGRSGVAQRATKLGLQSAPNAPAAAGGGLGGVQLRDIDSDTQQLARGVREAGNKAFYVRQNVASAATKKLLVTQETAELDLEKDKEKISVVERYSDAYFALTRDNTAEENQLMAAQQSDEELLIQLRGKNYLVK